MKPAEQSSVIAARLMEVFTEVGLPPGVLNLLSGQGETVGAALVDHPDTAVIAFTGSRAVGLAINRRAAEISAEGLGYVKPRDCRDGGKNAIIVDDDADFDEVDCWASVHWQRLRLLRAEVFGLLAGHRARASVYDTWNASGRSRHAKPCWSDRPKTRPRVSGPLIDEDSLEKGSANTSSWAM